MSAQAQPAPRHAWRDNIEAATMAIILAVMFKYFLVEAYKIPTGSMQPTLLGNEETAIFDRIIVDKLSYHFRDPDRFEVVIFKYPLDRSKNFIKRICGMPGEELKIENGDLWTRTDPNAAWRVLRRPRPVQEEIWKRLDPQDPRVASWKPDAAAARWAVRGRETIEARGSGSVTLPADGSSVVDSYRDGYPGKMGAALVRARRFRGDNKVGDLRVAGQVRALAGLKSITVELREGPRTYAFEIPGPQGPADARPRIVARGMKDAGEPEERVAALDQPLRVDAGKTISFAAQNMDDLLSFEIDGEVVLELEIPAAGGLSSSATLRIDGEGADFSELELYRDIYYTGGSRNTFKIPSDSYVMLGDNTQDSSDSREWVFAKYQVPAADGAAVSLRGNWRGENENPTVVPDGAQGNRIFFRDEWGELHNFAAAAALAPPSSEEAPFVPRHLITGRALIVFWPFVPSLNVWRLKWVR